MTPNLRTLFRFFLLLLALFVGAVQTAGEESTDSAQGLLECMFRSGSNLFLPQETIVVDVILRLPPSYAETSKPLLLCAALNECFQPDKPLLTGFNTSIHLSAPIPISFIAPEKEGVYEISLYVDVPVAESRGPLHISSLVSHTKTQRIEICSPFVVLSPQKPPRTYSESAPLSQIGYFTSSRDLLGDSPSLMTKLPFPKVAAKMADLPKMTDLPKPINLLKVSTSKISAGKASEGKKDSSKNSLFSSRLVSELRPWSSHFPSSSSPRIEHSEQHPEFSALMPTEFGAEGFEKSTRYALPIDTEIGKPYLVEIDVPVGIPQMLGVSIVPVHPHDKNRQDSVHQEESISTAVNIYTAPEMMQESSPQSATTHQLLFWAESNRTDLVLVNAQPDQEALFRNIKVHSIDDSVNPQGSNRLPKLFAAGAQRKRIAHLLGWQGLNTIQTPKRAYSSQYVQSAYEKSSRMIDTLLQGGYDGIVLPVLSNGISLYPIDGNAKEPQYHLEMMFRQWDSENLTLIPAIEFNMPILSLEILLIKHPGMAEEILVSNQPLPRQYNLLHPAVQQAMAETVLDLTNRFSHHPSWGGAAIILSPDCYSQLPFALYPPDDYTFSQFRQDTEQKLGIPFPDDQALRQTMPTEQFLAQKNARRVQFLQNHPNVWEEWVRWRMSKVSNFYADLAKQVAAAQRTAQHHSKHAAPQNDAPLYLLGGTMLDSPEIQQFCSPTLPQNWTPLQAVQLLGFDLSLLSHTESLQFLRPVQISPVPISNTKISEINNFSYARLNTADTLPLFAPSGSLTGVQFVHPDRNSFVTVSAAHQSRKRFVQQLTQADVMMFMDTGIALPLGQEPAMFDLLNTYRQLPPVPFQTFKPVGEDAPSLQPVTVRYHRSPEGLMIYMVNDAPFAVEADFFFSADSNSQLTECTGQRMIRSFNRSPQRGTHTWRASLLPYDLLSIRIDDPQASIESVIVERPAALLGDDGILKQKIEAIAQRIHAAQGGIPLQGLWHGLHNGNFEWTAESMEGESTTHIMTENITGWQCFGQSSIQLDPTVASQGRYSLKISNTPKMFSGITEPAVVLSQPFPFPATGRLGVSMMVGLPEGSTAPSGQPPAIRVLLSATHQGKPFYRSVSVGNGLIPIPNMKPQQGVHWHRAVVSFERLPRERLDDVRIGIEHAGGESIWIDDVSLYQVLFSASEMVELKKSLLAAYQRYSSNRVSDLLTQLDGYWMQFIWNYVPADAAFAVSAIPAAPVQNKPAEPKPTVYQRLKKWTKSIF